MSEIRSGAPRGKKSLFDGTNKWYWVGGAGGLIAIVYFYHKQKANAAAAASTADTSSADTSGTDTTGTSGYDTSYPSDYYGSNYDNGYGSTLDGYYDPSTGAYITPGTGSYLGTGVITAPTTNAAWSQQAVAYLVQQGYDPVATTAAIGAYLLGMGLTNDQMQIVQAAIGVEGPPPVSVPAPHVSPPTGQSGSGGTTNGSTQLATPVLSLDHVNAAAKRAALRWTAIPGVDHYQLNIGVPGASHVYANIPGSDTLASVTKSGPYHIYAVPPANSGMVMSHYSNTVVVPSM